MDRKYNRHKKTAIQAVFHQDLIGSQPAKITDRKISQENATRATIMAMGKFWKVNISFILTPFVRDNLKYISEF